VNTEIRAVRASADEVWAALSEPARIRQWWGRLDPAFRAGKLSQLDLGDGDVYALEVLRLEPPHRLEFRRRLLGIDSTETIRWQITPTGGCLVAVTWSAPGADDDARSAGREEWRSVTERLERFLAGDTLPPAPRDREFVLGTELPGSPESVRTHLEDFLAARFADGTILGDVRLRFTAAGQLTVELEHDDWAAPTSARIVVLDRGQGTKLVVRHRGWAATAYDGGERGRQRARFADFWHQLLLRFTLAYARSWRIPTLTAVDLNGRMAKPELFVFDANRSTLWERGHLPRAVFIGPEDIPLDRLPADKDAELVFYCRDSRCLTAYLSAARARTLGYPNTYVMEGGREAWADAGLPLVPENDAGVIEREKG
jgi:rhodanese-related sulfurtransferase/uncharacterized protein YndB with AHSA1/START domain